MTKSIVLLKSFTQLGYTVCFVRDSCLIPVDRQIPIGCNTFLQASRASSCDVSAIKQLIKIFSLTCNWPIGHDQRELELPHLSVPKQAAS